MTQWPELGGDDWEATRDTVQMWTQVVGKVRLSFEPAVNHWWQVPLYVSARGLTTSLVHTEDDAIEIEFDFLDHQLLIRSISGERRTVALEPRTVASFYQETMARSMRLACTPRSSPGPSRYHCPYPSTTTPSTTPTTPLP